MPPAFSLEALDHVAIKVADVDAAAEWYTMALGLKRIQLPEWGAYPVFMMSGRFGVALFPASSGGGFLTNTPPNIRIDHFAFTVTRENFDLARSHYEKLELNYSFQDHHYFYSLYVKDPDGHTVELTTLVKPASEVFDQ